MMIALLVAALNAPTLVNTCLITNDVPALVDFYEHVLGIPAQRTGADYAEFHTGATVLAIFSASAQAAYIPGAAKPAHNASALLEFRVDDIDAEFARLQPFVRDWVKRPAATPWRTRSFYFRDPDGNLVDFFAPLDPKVRGTIVVANMNDNTATIIDLATHCTIATLPTGAGPHEVATSRNGRWAVVSNYGPQQEPGHTLTVIDLAPRVPVVVRTIDLGADNKRPHGSAFLPGDTTLLVTVQTAQAVLVVNVPRGVVEASIPTHGRATHMVALTADGRHAYTSNVADGTVSELDITGRAFVRSFPVAPLVEGIGVTPNGAEVWVGSDSVKTVSVVPTSSGTVTTTVSDFGFPYRIAVTPDGRTAVVSDPGRGELRFMDVGTHTEIGRVAIPATDVVATAEFPKSPCPEGLSMAPDGRTVFVTLQGRNAVAAVDVATRTLLLTLPVGTWPDGIAYSTLEHN